MDYRHKILTLAVLLSAFCASAQEQIYLNAYKYFCANAITYRDLGSNATTTAALNYSNTAAATFSANTLCLVAVVSSLSPTWSKPTNVIGCGLTWVEVTSTNYNSGADGVSLWRSMTNATTPSASPIAMFAASQTGGAIHAFEFGNVDTSGANGAGAIVQAAKNAAATANPSVTLAPGSWCNAGLAVFGNVGGASSGFAGTAMANWTEVWDIGYNTPAVGAYEEYRLKNSDTTISVTASAQQWGGIAVEIKMKP